MHRRTAAAATVPVTAVLAALLPAVAPAAAAPPVPLAPADGAVSPTLRPVFTWAPGSSGAPTDHYEVFAEVGGAPLRVADAPTAATSARATLDLPDDGTYRWFVRLVNANGGTASTPVAQRPSVVVATVPGAPALTEMPSAAPGARSFAWAGDRVGSRWTVDDAGGRPVRSGEAAAASGRAEVDDLGDGAYVFRVTQTNAAGREGPAAARAFVVDATAPAAPTPVPAGGSSFAWTGMEPGATATWRVLAGDDVVAGPSDTAAARADAGPLRPGSYVFEVRQTDAAGNAGPWARLVFRAGSAAAAPAPGAAGAAGWRQHADLLRPSSGAVVRTRRPVLRWSGGPPGASLYNVQVFEVAGTRLRKVRSMYPLGTKWVFAPRRALRAGRCYVWRVWPYRGRGYTAEPLAVSDFCIRRADGAVR
ncbi:MAG TPA: hypothetical protein PKD59_15035 [Miltoncostaeaceae bacterium]|mgnify:FL=1|nr:hypothetical protein [Miltoncostaeaceae bacterium]